MECLGALEPRACLTLDFVLYNLRLPKEQHCTPWSDGTSQEYLSNLLTDTLGAMTLDNSDTNTTKRFSGTARRKYYAHTP